MPAPPALHFVYRLTPDSLGFLTTEGLARL